MSQLISILKSDLSVIGCPLPEQPFWRLSQHSKKIRNLHSWLSREKSSERLADYLLCKNRTIMVVLTFTFIDLIIPVICLLFSCILHPCQAHILRLFSVCICNLVSLCHYFSLLFSLLQIKFNNFCFTTFHHCRILWLYWRLFYSWQRRTVPVQDWTKPSFTLLLHQYYRPCWGSWGSIFNFRIKFNLVSSRKQQCYCSIWWSW